MYRDKYHLDYKFNNFESSCFNCEFEGGGDCPAKCDTIEYGREFVFHFICKKYQKKIK